MNFLPSDAELLRGYAVTGAHADLTALVHVVMRYFLNRTYGEAAALLGTSEGSVRHDVYLTFAGTNRGYQGLADIAWFSFNAPGTAVVSPPIAPAAGIRPAATVPATAPVPNVLGTDLLR